jgi:hypothetical protein
VVLTFGDHRLDIARRELRRGADIIDLEPKAFDLLAFLVLHRDRVVTKDDLLQAVWGGGWFPRALSAADGTSRNAMPAPSVAPQKSARGGPAADVAAAMQEHFEQADYAGVVDLDAGIADRTARAPRSQRELDVEVEDPSVRMR